MTEPLQSCYIACNVPTDEERSVMINFRYNQIAWPAITYLVTAQFAIV